MSATSERDPGRELDDKLPTGHTAPPEAQTASSASLDEDEQDEEEEEEDDREPNLKYTRLTSSLSSVYRNGDSTSSFLVSGDKMVGFAVKDAPTVAATRFRILLWCTVAKIS